MPPNVRGAPRTPWHLVVREAWASFARHDGPLLSAALAFYSLLAVAPLMLLAVAIAGLVLGDATASGELLAEVEGRLGPDVAHTVLDVVAETRRPTATWVASSIGIAFIFYASTRLFEKLQSALNFVFGVRAVLRPGAVRPVLAKRLVAYVMIVVFGLWVVLLVAFKSALAAAGHFILPLVEVSWPMHVLEFAGSTLVYAALVACVLKALPDVWISWGDAATGALVTATLLGLGNQLIGFYLGAAGPASAYGAAGTLIVLLLWLYYAMQIFVLGAEFTGALARLRGRGVRPSPHALTLRAESARGSLVG